MEAGLSLARERSAWLEQPPSKIVVQKIRVESRKGWFCMPRSFPDPATPGKSGMKARRENEKTHNIAPPIAHFQWGEQ
jgi:hypothetical protein